MVFVSSCRKRAVVHGAVCTVDKSVQREDLPVHLVLAGVCGRGHDDQFPGMDREDHLLQRQTELHQETPQIHGPVQHPRRQEALQAIRQPLSQTRRSLHDQVGCEVIYF